MGALALHVNCPSNKEVVDGAARVPALGVCLRKLVSVKTVIEFVHENHRGLAIGWFFFGILGVMTAVFQPLGLDVTTSIPALFFISVYANVIGHISALEANPDEDVVP